MNSISFRTIDSTNTYLKQHYHELEHLTFVSAEFQTAGRGRGGRVWHSDAAVNLMFSVLLKKPELLEKYRQVSVITAYAIIKVLETHGLHDLMIKWPNDIYASGRKICGILSEGVFLNEMECMIVGCGINVNQREFEGDYLRTPTSMALETGETFDMESLKKEIYAGLENCYQAIEDDVSFYSEISKYDYLKGRKAYAEINNRKEEVYVQGINPDYAITIVLDGRPLDVESGEITFHV